MAPLLSFSIVFLFGAFVIWADTPFVRYLGVSTDQICSVRQIVRAPRTIDFIALGSSRVRRGIDPDIVSQSSSGAIGPGVNFGRAGRDIGRSYHILRDLVQKGAVPRYALLEVDLEGLDINGRKRPMIASNRMAFDTYSDIMERASIFSDQPAFALKLATNALRAKLHYALIYHLNGTVFTSLFQIDQPYENTCRRPEDDLRSAERDAKLERELRKLKQKYPNLETAVIETFEFAHSHRARMEMHYLDLIRKLSHRHGIKLYITRQWSYMQPHYSEKARRQIKEVIPEFIYPDDKFIDSTMIEFPDDAHLGAKGRAIYSRWIGETIAAGGLK